MYNIDNRSLRSALEVSIIPELKEKDDTRDKLTYYFNLTLEMLVGAMNSKHKHISDAIDEQFERFPDDKVLPFLGEVISEELRYIKKQFILAGFDSRLKYKLITRILPRTTIKLYAIGMDLEATVVSMAEESEPEELDISDVISDNPTYEQLSAIYGSK